MMHSFLSLSSKRWKLLCGSFRFSSVRDRAHDPTSSSNGPKREKQASTVVYFCCVEVYIGRFFVVLTMALAWGLLIHPLYIHSSRKRWTTTRKFHVSVHVRAWRFEHGGRWSPRRKWPFVYCTSWEVWTQQASQQASLPAMQLYDDENGEEARKDVWDERERDLTTSE
jgi:hypothetical protein